jgi:hypothetical protein
MSVYEASKQIAEKANMGGPDHGLFYPVPDPERPGTLGKWLKKDKTLDFYDIKTGVCTSRFHFHSYFSRKHWNTRKEQKP